MRIGFRWNPSLLFVILSLLVATSHAGEPTLGIDVSHHSGEIDWSRIPRSEYGFVYLKATEGVDDADPMFEQHWKALEGSGIRRGAYHFYVTEDDPEEQARFFVSRVERLSPGDLPPVIDIELLGKGTSGDLGSKLERCLEIVERELGATPIIYTDVNFWNANFPDTFGRYPLWVAEYGVDEPRLPHGWSEWHIWQFEEDATLPGVEKGADRSRLHPDVDLDALAVGGSVATPDS